MLFTFPDVSKLLETVGVRVESVKSSPLKAAPSGFEPTSDAARAALASLVADSFTWFKGLVKERRNLSDAELASVADGRVFTGRQSLSNKLVDKLGGEREAVAWLETKGVTKDLPIRDWTRPQSGSILGYIGSAAGALGLQGAASLLLRLDSAARASVVDGLLAIWQG